MSELVEKLYKSLNNYATPNEKVEAYYEGDISIPKLGIGIPPVLNHIATVVGWPGTCVDVLDERLDFQGWDDDGKYGMEKLYNDNAFDYESNLINIDCLLYGIAFGAVSTGTGDEPPALLTAESPKDTTGVYNRRTRRLDIAFTRYADEEGKYTKAVLYLPDKNIYYARKDEHSKWAAEKTDAHNLGRVTVVRFINRGRAGRRGGKSEITRAIRSYTDTAVRTLLGMEVNREFYQAPQRYVLGAKENTFTDEAGLPIPGWKANMGALWTLERDDKTATDPENKSDGMPVVGQFAANPPGPYLEQVRGLSMLVAAESGIPPSYLGFVTDNPPSADSIRALEGRLVKRAERRQAASDPSYIEMGQLAAMISNKMRKPPPREDFQTLWRDAATPTKAADADRAVKLTGAGILPAASRITYEMAGLSPKQIKQIERDMLKDEFRKVLTEGMKPGVPTDQAVVSDNPASSVPAVGPADK